MKATKEQIKEAFRKTIHRWEMIVEDPDYRDGSYCHLCILENIEGNIIQFCNESCPIRGYKGEDHFACDETPCLTFFNNQTKENALVELNFLREVYLDFLENLIQEQCDELCMAMKAESEEAKKEWVDITKEIEWRLHQAPYTRGYWVRGYYKGEPIVWLDNDGIDSFSSYDTKIEKSDMSFNVIKRIEK